MHCVMKCGWGYGESHQRGAKPCPQQPPPLTRRHDDFLPSSLPLFRQIDRESLQSLNTQTGHGIESCMRPPCQIGGPLGYLETDGDEQAILTVSFTEGVCVKSICVVASGDSSPKKVKLFVDKEVGHVCVW